MKHNQFLVFNGKNILYSQNQMKTENIICLKYAAKKQIQHENTCFQSSFSWLQFHFPRALEGPQKQSLTHDLISPWLRLCKYWQGGLSRYTKSRYGYTKFIQLVGVIWSLGRSGLRLKYTQLKSQLRYFQFTLNNISPS